MIDRKIQMIRVVRSVVIGQPEVSEETFHLGLKQAKDIVDAIEGEFNCTYMSEKDKLEQKINSYLNIHMIYSDGRETVVKEIVNGIWNGQIK